VSLGYSSPRKLAIKKLTRKEIDERQQLDSPIFASARSGRDSAISLMLPIEFEQRC